MSDGVILLHGIARTSRAMNKLERGLRGAGYRTLNVDYPSRRFDIPALADYVHAAAESWTATIEGQVHFVTHSMGGLVARATIHRHRPARLGRVVMLVPPNQGSEIADLLGQTRIYNCVFGPAGQQLGRRASQALQDQLGPIDYDLGIIAGNRAIDPLGWAILPKPNDGKVCVAATKSPGMADHIVLPATHTFVMRDAAVIEATVRFLSNGRFGHPA